MSKHTQGPWIVDDHADATGTVRIISPGEGHIVAEGIDPCDGLLIAASPKMLSMLRTIVFDRYGRAITGTALHAEARNLVSVIEGRS